MTSVLVCCSTALGSLCCHSQVSVTSFYKWNYCVIFHILCFINLDLKSKPWCKSLSGEGLTRDVHIMITDTHGSLVSEGICNCWKLRRRIPLERAIALQNFNEIKRGKGFSPDTVQS